MSTCEWIVVGLIVLAIAQWYGFAMWRSMGKTQPYTRYSRYNPNPGKVLFMHFPGLNGHPKTQIENILPAFQRRGTVVYVNYEGSAGKRARWFDRKAVVAEAYSTAHEWHRRNPKGTIVLLGTSLGARLAYQVAHRLWNNDGIQTKALLMHPPRNFWGLRLFQQVLTIAVWLIYYLPVFNLLLPLFHLLRPLFMKVVAAAPKDSEIEQSVKDSRRKYDSLMRTVEQAQKTKPSFFFGQVVSMLAPLPRRGHVPWGEHDVFVIRSKEDVVVKYDSFIGWERLIGDKTIVVNDATGAPHAGSGAAPSAYTKPVRRGLKFLIGE